MAKGGMHYQIEQGKAYWKTLYIQNFLPIRSVIQIFQFIPEITMRTDWFPKLSLGYRMQADINPNYQ